MKPINKFKEYAVSQSSTNAEKLEFSDRLGTLMTKRRKSINDLSTALNVSYEMARRYLTGAGRPSHEKGQRLAEWLDVGFDWLWYGDEDKVEIEKRIPLFSITDADVGPGFQSRYSVPVEFSAQFAVVVNNPLGSELDAAGVRLFKTGDKVWVGEGQFGLGDRVLIKARDRAAFAKHLIRRVEFDKEMNIKFAPEDSKYPTIGDDKYEVIGKILGVSSSL